MSTEIMKSIEGVKVSDVFDFTAVGFPVFWTDEQVRVCGRALRNYDDMNEELHELRAEHKQLESDYAKEFNVSEDLRVELEQLRKERDELRAQSLVQAWDTEKLLVVMQSF